MSKKLSRMGCIVFCWELGGGFGHGSKVRGLVAHCLERGARVFVIARNLATARRVFRDTDAVLLQAPMRHGGGNQPLSTPMFAHILSNVGYGDEMELSALTSGWRNLFQMIQPKLIIADHSPTALLAARILSIPAVVIGSGFSCPPDESPLPDLQPWLRTDSAERQAVEGRVLDNMNRVLSQANAPTLQRVTELYHDGPLHVLLTFQELDHFPQRTGERYWGYWPFQGGAAPQWPSTGRPRVFAYLKPSRFLPGLLTALSQTGLPVLIYVDKLDAVIRRQFEGSRLRFADDMVDLAAVIQDCDVTVSHGGLGTTTASLLCGKPVLSIPLQLEQLLIAQAVERLCAGVTVAAHQPASLSVGLQRILKESSFSTAAQAFAERYRDFNAEDHHSAVCARLDEIHAELVASA